MTATEQEERPHAVRGVVDRLDELSSSDVLSVREVVAAFGQTSFLPVMLIPALLVISPLSGIPLFSSFCGISIALIAGQMLARRRHLWLPDFIMRRRLDGARMHKAATWLGRIADWIDRLARPRLRVLTDPPVNALPQMLCVLCGLAMPFLELLPFSSSLLGTAVALIAAGFLSRDGLFVLVALLFVGFASSVPFLVAAASGLSG
ncbi:Uncharacterized conserved protein [Tranquillimonas rosea]|uniref:Uncharacterized conserved protein n=1 Tax=Tranquillimonas rosea TaxID=641238 RepID=A0A1H9RR81_9RHOB|nr:exopolysaccharide biosynthesis protein [Tranquillimonas rosea]SER75157.1 Uncharacterized conserved protein [Tranquillimonas rosea]